MGVRSIFKLERRQPRRDERKKYARKPMRATGFYYMYSIRDALNYGLTLGRFAYNPVARVNDHNCKKRGRITTPWHLPTRSTPPDDNRAVNVADGDDDAVVRLLAAERAKWGLKGRNDS